VLLRIYVSSNSTPALHHRGRRQSFRFVRRRRLRSILDGRSTGTLAYVAETDNWDAGSGGGWGGGGRVCYVSSPIHDCIFNRRRLLADTFHDRESRAQQSVGKNEDKKLSPCALNLPAGRGRIAIIRRRPLRAQGSIRPLYNATCHAQVMRVTSVAEY